MQNKLIFSKCTLKLGPYHARSLYAYQEDSCTKEQEMEWYADDTGGKDKKKDTQTRKNDKHKETQTRKKDKQTINNDEQERKRERPARKKDEESCVFVSLRQRQCNRN